MGCFEDMVAIVTGGGAGIGETLFRELARRGALVTVADINGDDAERVTTTIASDGERTQARRVDVADEQDTRRLIEQTAAAYGRVDYLFNNAGIAIGGDARDLTLDQWRRVLDVDLYGVLNGTVAAYPIVARQGSATSSTCHPQRACCRNRSTPLLHGQARHCGAVPLAAPGGRRPRREGQRRLPWLRAHQHLPENGPGQHAARRGGPQTGQDDRALTSGGYHPRWCGQQRCADHLPWVRPLGLARICSHARSSGLLFLRMRQLRKYRTAAE